MSLILLVLLCAVRFNTISCCHERDRSSLLSFKQGVVDPSNLLSSWSTLPDCCQWDGVQCDHNNRVFGLSLSAEYLRGYENAYHRHYYVDRISNNHSESLRGEINLSSLLALEFLERLNLGDNDFERISMAPINNSVATHTHLPHNSSKLLLLSLSYNIHLHIDNLHYWLSRLPSLTSLDLSGVHLPSETNWVQSLASLPLNDLNLCDCNLTTSILPFQHANFSSLSYLDLSLNDLTFGLPNWLFNLSKDHLHSFYLSQCNLRGQIPDLSGYRNLMSLDLSNNKLKGSIPKWLGQLHRLTILDLSNNSFHGSIPSDLLNASALLDYLDISFNNLSGPLPNILGQNKSANSIGVDISNLFPRTALKIFMSFNKFEGRLPRVQNWVQALDLSYNYFSGSLYSSLCHSETNQSVLEYLDLSNNYLTQELPDCWNSRRYLVYIYLENNQLTGRVPAMMGSSLPRLRALDLHNNDFSGDIPSTFNNCTYLVLLNLEENNFSGGSIPHCLHNATSLASLKNVLDFRTGPRPPSDYTMPTAKEFMKIDLHIKGQQLDYGKTLKLVRSIDLSANRLSGEIPVQLFKLTKLQSLNLSYNYLIGEIPEQIGEMKDLESFDLSHNNLHGNIPQSMAGLSFLDVLNMSYNHFSGQIPLGTQLQSFDAWSYAGNPELCGPPLQKNCTIPDNTEKVEENEDDGFLKSLYLGMGVGFAVGFWVVSGSLLLNKAWRHSYFRFFNGVVDRIYVIVAIKLQRFH
ncbi:receptor-like protein EIX2 [Neltuma alba]|uniref:receptor-like protein EIX2 n=1 Tax=Neltuma alba TaxID=207710 RepID=UPI0010A42BF8|nr:receptor-like protein EIX2 [Prosopis alba]